MNRQAPSTVRTANLGLKDGGSNPQALSPFCRFGALLMESQLDSFFSCLPRFSKQKSGHTVNVSFR